MANNAAAKDVKSMTWTSAKSLAAKRVYSAAVEHNGLIYVVGGCDAMGTPVDTLEVYNPEKNQWRTLANMPTRRAAPCCAVVEGKLVVVGGIGHNQDPVDSVEVYDPAAKSWEVKDTLSDKVLGLSCVVRDGKMVVIGGMSIDTNPKDYLMQYDHQTDRWKMLPSMPTPRYATFSFLISDKLYVLGGRQGNSAVATLEVFDFTDNRWRTLPEIPSKRVFALYVATDTHIYSLGGLDPLVKLGFKDCTEVFDCQTEKWTIGEAMKKPRGDFAATHFNGKVVVAGGLSKEGKPISDVEAYDLETNTWMPLTSMTHPTCSMTYFTSSDKRLYVIGGLNLAGPSAVVQMFS